MARRPSLAPSQSGWIVAAAAILALAGTEAQLVINGRTVSAPVADDTRLVVNGDTVSTVSPSEAAAAAVTLGLDLNAAAAAEPAGVGGRLVINGEAVALSPAVAKTPLTINGRDSELTVQKPELDLDALFATDVGTKEESKSRPAGDTRPGNRRQQIAINGNTVSLPAAVIVTNVIYRTVTSCAPTPAAASATVTAESTKSSESVTRTLHVPGGVSGKSKTVLLVTRPLQAPGAAVTYRPRPSATYIRLPQTGEPGRVTLSVTGTEWIPPPPITRPAAYYLPPPAAAGSGPQQQQSQGAGDAGMYSFLWQSHAGSTITHQSSGERNDGPSLSHVGTALVPSSVHGRNSTATYMKQSIGTRTKGSSNGISVEEISTGSSVDGPNSEGRRPSGGAVGWAGTDHRPWGALAAGARPLSFAPLPLVVNTGTGQPWTSRGSPVAFLTSAVPAGIDGSRSVLPTGQLVLPGRGGGVSPVTVMLPLAPAADRGGGGTAARIRASPSDRPLCRLCSLIGYY